MTSHFTETTGRFFNTAVDFAAREIKPLRLGADNTFPHELWRRMGESGLLGLMMPKGLGGASEGHLTLSACGEALVRYGGNMGIVISWMIHNIVSRLIFVDAAPPEVKERYGEKLARGEITASLAISEPGVGPHPKHLSTTARGENGVFILNGEKSFLTNAPLAEVFAVLAITAQQGKRKRYSIILVPRETPGLHLTAGTVIDFLRPSPHGGIRMENCRVAADNLIGVEGEAYKQIALPFRDWEDIALMGPTVGGLAVRTGLIAQALREEGITITDDIREAMGGLFYLTGALRVLAYEAATAMDAGRGGEDLLALTLAFRALAKRHLMRGDRLLISAGVRGNAPLKVITEDLRRTLGIATNILTIKQRRLGDNLLT